MTVCVCGEATLVRLSHILASLDSCSPLPSHFPESFHVSTGVLPHKAGIDCLFSCTYHKSLGFDSVNVQGPQRFSVGSNTKFYIFSYTLDK